MVGCERSRELHSRWKLAILTAIGNDAARFRFGQYLDRYPDSPQVPAIRQRLSS